ncbi:hypothetical protein [Fastidiosibacter lacustris]|uniref:hypothetical protein n=1 Tax=Fastidiosibacter lacustris TaxID=2056695 RepID=UPI000E352372|nr:hypothetical protein [Fastidiosibacter lacustris]
MDWDFKLQSGIDIPLPSYAIRPAFWAFFPLLTGKIVDLNTPQIKSEYLIQWSVTKGQVICNNATNIVDKAAVLRVFADSYKTLVEDFDYIAQFQAMEVIHAN